MSVSKHTAYNLAGALIPLALSFVTVPIYLHLVGPDRYGVLAIAWLLLGYFGLFDLGLGRATSYRIASLKDPNGAVHADVFKTAVGINMGIGVVGGAILWAAGWWFFGSIFKVGPDLRAETLQALPWLAASVPVATMTGVLSGALQGREKFLETNTVSVISTVLFQIFPLSVAWFYGPNLAGLLAAAVFARVAAIVVLWFSCHKEFTRGHTPRWRRDEARLLLGFGGWVTLNGLMGPALIMADRFLIGAVLGARAVAVYTIPFQLAQRSGVVPTALTGALFPRLSATAAQDRAPIVDKAVRALACLTTVPVFIALFIFKPFLVAWIGPALAEQSYRIGMIVIIAFWANSFVAIYFSVLQASGRPSAVSKILVAQLVPYLVALWFVLKYWGLEGAAWLFLVRAYATFLPMMVWQKPATQTVALIVLGMVGLLIGFEIADNVIAGKLISVGIAGVVLTVLTGISVVTALSDFPHLFKKLGLQRR